MKTSALFLYNGTRSLFDYAGFTCKRPAELSRGPPRGRQCAARGLQVGPEGDVGHLVEAVTAPGGRDR